MIGAIVAGGLSAMTPPVTNSWESIETFTVGSGGTSSITFGSGGTIPQTYKHLQLRGIARCASSTDRNLRLIINGDTTNSNYAQHWLYGNGSGSGASEYNAVSPQIGYLPMSSDTSGMFGATVTDILDYTSTNKLKTVRVLAGNDMNGSSSGLVFLGSGLWVTGGTAAITSLTVKMSNGSNLAEYSSFALYGIKG